MIVLYIVALVVELAGLVLAADGLRRTWNDFRRPDDAFWVPAQAIARRVYSQARKLVRKPVGPSGVIVEGIGISVALGTPTVTGTGWSVPPTDDTKAYVEYLARRIDHLSEQVQQVGSRVQVEANTHAAQHAEAGAAISEVRSEMRGQVRTITIDGLFEQAIGWGLIFLGTVLGGVGNIISAS